MEIVAFIHADLQNKYKDFRMRDWKHLNKNPLNLTPYYVPWKSKTISNKDFKCSITEYFEKNTRRNTGYCENYPDVIQALTSKRGAQD